ncbi:hypothetical protein SARC_08276 [Sphaeroforma arctica JP610]|uniref:Phospholipid/glycerol acyltransferase domain-containing protein n=1 Tax=Sphaeroforma arctica JP610 TaxID=667725 RepID=A0A0L0FR83_9EUKA|nr:hypothetical protein SARC_08276 [Sphaeroforma arctica JP610]KNC79327.1 hypothetical protein SARC_08276 [Sphaeroforma arctica JP610]|eukprot:XP_014153229.1 hypothetical protein SARC_08276 [Sphaeroforma arctica JP610]
MLQRKNPTFFEMLLSHWIDQLNLFVVTLFFSEIDVLGHENLQKYGPSIYVGNHQNQFVDAILLSAVIKSEQNRGLRFIIAEKSYHRPLIGHLAKVMNSIPVARPQDSAKKGIGTVSVKEGETTVRGQATTFTVDFAAQDSIKIKDNLYKVLNVISDNEMEVTGIHGHIDETVEDFAGYKIFKRVDQHKMYGAVYESFLNGSILGIFPEGGSHDRTELLPLKAGVCIMALGAMTTHPGLNVNVVPCGINYSQANRFRSKVVIQFGVPIEIKKEEVELYTTDKHKAIGDLLERVTVGLQDVVVQTPDHEALVVVHYLRRLYVPVGRHITPYEYHELNQRFSKAYAKMDELPFFADLKATVLEYRRDLKIAGITDSQVAKMQTAVQMGKKRKAFYEMIEQGLLLTSYLLAYLPGFLLAFPAGFIVETVAANKQQEALRTSDVKIKANDVVASWKVLTGMIVVPALSILYAFLFMLYLYFATDYTFFTKFVLVVAFAICVPFYSHQSVLAADDIVKAAYAIRPLFLRATGAFQSSGEKWITRRSMLQKYIRETTWESFDQLYPNEFRIFNKTDFEAEAERMDEKRRLRRLNTVDSDDDIQD